MKSKIKNKMLESGKFLTNDFMGRKKPLESTDRSALMCIDYLPEIKASEMCYSLDSLLRLTDICYINQFFENNKDKTFFKFKPYVTEDDSGNAMLVLGLREYIYINSDGKYAMSDLPDKKLDLKTSCIFAAGERAGRDVEPMLYYIRFLAFANQFSSFRKLLREHPDVVDEFVAANARKHFISYKVTYYDVLDLLEDGLGNHTCYDEVYEVSGVARCYVRGGHHITIEYCKNGEVKLCSLNIKKLTDGNIDTLINNNYQQLIAFMFSLVGVSIDSNGVCSSCKLNKLYTLNNCNVTCVRNFWDLL